MEGSTMGQVLHGSATTTHAVRASNTAIASFGLGAERDLWDQSQNSFEMEEADVASIGGKIQNQAKNKTPHSAAIDRKTPYANICLEHDWCVILAPIHQKDYAKERARPALKQEEGHQNQNHYNRNRAIFGHPKKKSIGFFMFFIVHCGFFFSHCHHPFKVN